jgi:cell division septal protein FtsQ
MFKKKGEKQRLYKSKTIYRNKLSATGRKRYRNPFFANKKEQRSRPRILKLAHPRLIIAAITLIIGISVWFCLYSDFFRLEKVEASGQGRLDANQLEQTALEAIKDNLILLFPDKNLFFLDIKRIESALRNEYAFDELTIEKNWPRSLKISYNEKDYAYIWEERGKYHYIDIQGYLVTETTAEEIKNKKYSLLENIATNTPATTDRVPIAPEILDFISRAKGLLNKNPDLETVKYQLSSNTTTVIAKLVDGPDIYLDASGDLNKQISKLLIVKNEKLKDSFKNKSYIDVRIDNNVYYQ